MGSNGVKEGRTPVWLVTGVNQEPVPPDSETLCKFCKRISFTDVGFKHSLKDFFGRREIREIRTDSKTCRFCRELAEFYDEWSRKKFGKEGPDLERSWVQIWASFSLHKEGSLSISHRHPDYRPMPTVNRIWVSFGTAEAGSFLPLVQFQKYFQPPLPVSKGETLFGWESGEEQAYSGRIRPLVADTRFFRKWQETCCAIHGDHCNSIFTGERLPRLRLIDVEKRCIVDCFLHEEKGYFVGSEVGISYTALSYVWGRYKLLDKLFPELTEKTEWEFQKAGSITREKVLSTIDDAMEVTLGLGERYLWVDCLCIRQDDEADKGKFIRQMDSIYGFALVTIVAASGDNADAGLPGIKPSSRTCEQKLFTIKGVSLLRTLDPLGSDPVESNDMPLGKYYYLKDSVWLTRGWTLQEKIFSARALIFTEEQVYWECQTATWCEDGFWETKKSPIIYRPCFKNDFRCLWTSNMNSFEGRYLRLVVEYSRRTLTCGSDGLDAFEGILNALKREAHQDFLWALPKSLLSKMLTWFCEERSINRREEMCPLRSSDSLATDCPFPSWSWVGWVGVVNSFITDASDLIFYHLNGKQQLCRVVEADDAQGISSKRRNADSRSWQTGRTNVTLEEIPDSVLLQSIASNILFFWSSTAKLDVRHADWTYDGYALILSHKDKDLWCEWSQIPVLEPGLKDPSEFVVIGVDEPYQLALILVEWKDGVAYRRGLATVHASDWDKLDNREWKLICLG